MISQLRGRKLGPEAFPQAAHIRKLDWDWECAPAGPTQGSASGSQGLAHRSLSHGPLREWLPARQLLPSKSESEKERASQTQARSP